MAVVMKQMSGYISHKFSKRGPKFYRCSISVKQEDGTWRFQDITGFAPYKDGDKDIARELMTLDDHQYVTVRYFEKTRTYNEREYVQKIVTNIETSNQ